jgi:hypothetical protein
MLIGKHTLLKYGKLAELLPKKLLNQTPKQLNNVSFYYKKPTKTLQLFGNIGVNVLL